MKKTIIYTTAAYIILVAALLGCEKLEEDKGPSCDNKQYTEQTILYLNPELVYKMVKSPTDDNIFTWYLDVSDACPAGDLKLNFDCAVEYGKQTNVDVSFASVVTAGNKSYYDFYPESGKSVLDQTYDFTGGTQTVKTTCSGCDPKTKAELSASIQIKVTGPGITDYANFIANHVTHIRITMSYYKPGTE